MTIIIMNTSLLKPWDPGSADDKSNGDNNCDDDDDGGIDD